MASVFCGTISFGLITIPVKASTAARESKISFNQLHSKCGCRINQKTVCTTCGGIEVKSADIVKGFDEKNGTFLHISADELKACTPSSSKVMEIEEVVDASEVDPLWFDASYYLEPEEAGRKGYKLLVDALKAEKKVAIAHLTLSQREHVVIIRPYGKGLAFHTLWYPPEVHDVPSAATVDAESNPAELKLARQLLLTCEAKFDPSQYFDGYQARVVALLESKRAGQPAPKPAAEKPAAAPMDLMAALAASLAKKKAA